MKMYLALATLCLSLPLMTHAQLWTGDWYPEVSVKLLQDDNVTRSPKGNKEKSETVLEGSVRAEQQQQLDAYTFSHIAVALYGEVYSKYNGLNMASPSLDAGLRHQVGEGDGALSLSARMGLAYEFFNQDWRNGIVVMPSLEARIGLAENVSGGLHYIYDNKFASDNPVYDIDGHTIGMDTEWLATEEISLSVGYSYRRGGTIVHEPRDDLGMEIRGERYPIDTFKMQRYDAVNLDNAETHTLYLEAQYDVNLYTAVRVGYVYEEIKGGGEKYPSNQFYLGYFHQL